MATILVIDDAQEARDFVKRALGEEHEVYALEDWTKAAMLVVQHKPDLILMDMDMPSIFTGDKIADMLQKSIRGQSLNIVLFSSMNEYELRKKAHEVGARGYISKTFDERLLRVQVKRYLK